MPNNMVFKWGVIVEKYGMNSQCGNEITMSKIVLIL